MAKEKNPLKRIESVKINRRSFLKGTAGTAAVAAAAASGVMALLHSPIRTRLGSLVGPAHAAGTLYGQLPKAHQNLDPDQKQDDLGDLANTYRAALDESLTKGDKVVEKLIMDAGFRNNFQKNSALAVKSLVGSFDSPLPLGGFKVPDSIMKKAEQIKAEGWHWHSSFSVWGWNYHSHMSW